jgi:hypothetical protein
MGNATSPRMDRVRPKDINLYDKDGVLWVVSNSGGISTFSGLGRGKNWWRLDEGTAIPETLRIVNDYGDHWLWEPVYSMPLQDYEGALRTIGNRFYKVN